MKNDHDIAILNGLIRTTLDSVNGYQQAASEEGETAGRFGAIFRGLADERKQIAAVLRAGVIDIGGRPADGSSFLGAASRTFMNLQALTLAQNNQAVLCEIERSEEHLKADFEEALRNVELSLAVRLKIEDAYRVIISGKGESSNMRKGVPG
jgi:uncharacterized protein (TIGR02284 family)